ncbi:MAG: prepilin-type N-terminal cleavage/methylation domain-containing protein [Elusimicrobiaceae bacterium]|nr:prepilin-type N-terminal cleavage/methylation domain-containing protein [Elusimicrobiaceae bacterium]
MKNNKNGFTLIEILVAVLIMIILVTMAVPMYEKAIEKSRVAEVSTTLKKIGDSKLRIMDQMNLANFHGGASNDFNMKSLDVEMPTSNEFTYSLYPESYPNAVCAVRAKGEYQGTVFLYLGDAAADYCDCSTSHSSGSVCHEYCLRSTKVFCGGTHCEEYGMDNFSVGTCNTSN